MVVIFVILLCLDIVAVWEVKALINSPFLSNLVHARKVDTNTVIMSIVNTNYC